jgi:DNA repair protein RadC
MTIKQLPAALRPREKLLNQGPQCLADAELLALLLRTGNREHSVLAMAQNMLDQFSGLAGLMQASAGDLRRIKGLGPAKVSELCAVIEIARRAMLQGLSQEPIFESPSRVKEYLQLRMSSLEHEVFAVLFLDSQHRLLCMEEMFRGTLTQASVYPREVVKRALALNAGAVVLTHNHPSGVAEPSRADERITATLRDALQLVDVRVLDHIIVGRGQTVSLSERGLM